MAPISGAHIAGAEMDAPTSEETPDKAAQYIAALTRELAELARRNGLETLSQILEMAQLEAHEHVNDEHAKR
ncbi:MAG TPA: hypothetical protein VGV62_00720 [Xanthobacteraceae bacterium]|jgi:glutamate synthase domain-containing protein 2|nr:hypothetical protein [Xanthobacteraceae bacterium]